ncbi:MAG: hypothetical protein K5912_03230 [Alphaproteobacteria bacterium]|nr:hypothetical protein [Alphaproteobacteria bacterium]
MSGLKTSLNTVYKKCVEEENARKIIYNFVVDTLNKRKVVYKDGVYKTKNYDGYVIKQTYYLIPGAEFYMCHLENDGYKTKKDLIEINMDYNLRNRLDIRYRAQTVFSFVDGPTIMKLLRILDSKQQ